VPDAATETKAAAALFTVADADATAVAAAAVAAAVAERENCKETLRRGVGMMTWSLILASACLIIAYVFYKNFNWAAIVPKWSCPRLQSTTNGCPTYGDFPSQHVAPQR
jgi:hypothetical protein